FSVDGVSGNIGSGTNFQFYQQAAGSLPGLSIFGGTNTLASVDAVQEFRVQTSSYSAEFGRQPGGQISLVTRSGTNNYTGSLFNYFRNEKLDANDWFENRAGRDRRALRQNNYGGTFGGKLKFLRFGEGVPAIWDGKDRSFFFVSYEGLRLTQPQTSVLLARVPSRSARAAATGPFKQVLDAFPLPNSPFVAGDPADTERYVAALSYPSKVDALSFRIDQKIAEKVNVFGRFNEAPSSQRFRAFPSQNNAYENNIRTLTVGSTQTFSSKLVNDLRVNYSYTRGLFLFEGIGVDGSRLPDNGLLFPSFAPPENASVSIVLGTGGSNISSANLTQGKTIGTKQRQINIVNNLTTIVGNHELKFGVDYRRLTPKVDSRALGITYNFTTVAARASGIPNSISVQALAPITDFKVENLSLFAQDTWRVNQRLTLTGGLRWEFNPPLSGDRLPFQISGIDNLLTATLARAGTKQWKNEYENFAPRVGVAFTVSEKLDLVARAGFGIYYDLGTGTALRGSTSYPYNSNKTITNPAQLRFPANEIDLQPLPFLDASPPPYSANFFFFDPNLKLPYTRQWNVSVEKGFGRDNSLTVSYVGAAGRELLRNEQLQNFNSGFVRARFCTPAPNPLTAACSPAANPPPVVLINPAIFGPNPALLNDGTQILNGSAVSITRNGASSDYHAMQTQFQSRFMKGLQTIVSYTWAKAIDDVSDETITGIPLQNAATGLERGPANFDVRHNFTAAISYDLPTWKANSLTKAIFGGWAVDSIMRARSGLPFSVISQSFDPLNIGTTRRVNLLGGVPIWLVDSSLPGGRKLNAAAFSAPQLGFQGTLGRNSLRSFSQQQIDLSIRRTFSLTEKLRFQFRGEAFNVFNTPNFGFPAASFGFAGFGEATTMLGRSLSGTSSTSPSNGFNSLYQVGGPRSLQFSLKLLF
ncbi:MAG: TonB-dependent receptor domain-containing protein, partial [Blastocatellia bacterium]